MKFLKLIFRILFILLFLFIFSLIFFNFFSPVFNATSLIFPYAVHPFDICNKAPILWHYIKIVFIFSFLFNSLLFINSIFSFFFTKNEHKKINKSTKKTNKNLKDLNLYVGKIYNNNSSVFITEKNLYQNILITGTIGSGKTSSAIYPFTKQLIKYKCNLKKEKLGMLILDVKGNFHKFVQNCVEDFNRTEDLIVIEVGGKYKYNPLHKPNLKASVLANRLKTILTLFSPNNTESYWLDKAEQVLTECIKFCRLYNNRVCNFCRN